MRLFISHFIIIMFAGLISCGSKKSKTGQLNASSLITYGRCYMDWQQNLALVSTASHFGYRFSGKESRLYVSISGNGAHNYLQYEVDGVYKGILRIDSNNSQPLVISSPANGEHTVWIYKNTEAHTGPINVKKIVAENIEPVEAPVRPTIEFIGNSITCGAQSDTSLVACDQGEYHDHHNAYFSYGPRVARAIGANFTISAVSGIGMYINWNSDGPTMPQVYENTRFENGRLDFLKGNNNWDFSKNIPDVVSIALGTNDFSGGDGINKRLAFDSFMFIGKYVQFVQLVKSKYPKARILLLNSPILGEAQNTVLQQCLLGIKQKIDGLFPRDQPVITHFLKLINAQGCTGHPSVADHALIANDLGPVLKKIL